MTFPIMGTVLPENTSFSQNPHGLDLRSLFSRTVVSSVGDMGPVEYRRDGA